MKPGDTVYKVFNGEIIIATYLGRPDASRWSTALYGEAQMLELPSGQQDIVHASEGDLFYATEAEAWQQVLVTVTQEMETAAKEQNAAYKRWLHFWGEQARLVLKIKQLREIPCKPTS